MATIFFVLGWQINKKYSGHTMSFLFLLIAYLTMVSIIASGLILLHFEGTWQFSPSFYSALETVYETTWQPVVSIPVFLMPLFYPTGKLLSRYWRGAVVLYLLILTYMLMAIVFVPWPNQFNGVTRIRPVNGVAAVEPFFVSLIEITGALFGFLFLLACLSIFVRFLRSRGIERQQMKWPLWAMLCVILIVTVRSLVPEINQLDESFGYAITWATGLLLPFSIGIAILQYRLWDIDVVINRTLVYGVLTLLTVGLYVAIVAGVGALFQTQTSTFGGLVATAVIAVLFQPMRTFLQRAANRLLYGERDDPTAVLTQLAQQLESAHTPADILPNLTHTIAQTLKLPHVAIWLPNDDGRFEPVAHAGQSPGHVEMIPLTYQQETIGQLAVAPRDANGRFTRQEQKLLSSIAALTANTVRAVQLSDELRQSRQRIVTAREEERRRLRRDLHDGLGPQLASQTLGLAAAARLIDNNPEKAKSLLEAIQQQSQTTVADIRHLIMNCARQRWTIWGWWAP
jgi:signal transduction histidine kinase